MYEMMNPKEKSRRLAMKVTDASGGQGDFFREGLWCILMERQEDADPKHPENV